jgi:putative peptidoglycan lipid II flippase
VKRWPTLLASLWGTAITVGGFTAAAKLVSLVKDSLVASRFGNGAELDAFLLALALPAFLVNVAAGTLPAALTPTYIAARERDGVEVGRAVAIRVLHAVYRALAALAVGAAVTSFAFAYLPGASLAATTREMLPWVALTLAPYTLLQGVCAAWSGLLAAERGFAITASAPIAQPIFMVGALVVAGADATVGTLVVGLITGTLVQGFILARALRERGLVLWQSRREGVQPATDPVVSGHVRMVRLQYLPTMASACLMSATTITDQTIAAWLPPGSVSALNYGNKIAALMMGIGSIALSTTLLPHLSKLVAHEEWVAIRLLLKRVALGLIAVTVPVTAVLTYFDERIVSTLYERGAFTASHTALVANVQSAYLLQLPVHLLGILYVRLISALRANRFLTISATVCVIANIALDIVFMRRFGVSGIALATASIYTISCGILGTAAYHALRRMERATAVRHADELHRERERQLAAATVNPATSNDREACASAA